jgi:hypothetical protein
MTNVPRDRKGREVVVGAMVRLVELSESFLNSLPKNEVEDVRTMIGEVFEVTEIGKYGSPWVGKGWTSAEGDRYYGHSIALSSSEMEVVDDKSM